MAHYWDYESRKAHDKGEDDARWGFRQNYNYDRYSDRERDKAYFDGYREEERRQEERREEERRQEEREQEQREYRRREQQRQEQYEYECRLEEERQLKEQWSEPEEATIR